MGKVGKILGALPKIAANISSAKNAPLDFPFSERGELETWQDAKLRDLVTEYWEHSPGFRENLRRAGVRSPEEIRGFADLDSRGYRTTKEEIQGKMPSLLRDNLGPTLELTTSGTTGNLTKVLWEYSDMLGPPVFSYRQALEFGGVPRGSRIIVLAPEGSSMAKGVPLTLKLTGLAGKVDYVDTSDPEGFARLLPGAQAVIGYARSVPVFLWQLRDEIKNMRADGKFQVKAAITGGGPLTPAREDFLRSLGVRPENMYGMVEHGVATEFCRDGETHQHRNMRILVDEKGLAWMTPLVPKTYADVNGATGDLVELSYGCRCGSPSPIVKVRGRAKFAEGEVMKHLPADFAQGVADLITQEIGSPLTGLYTVKYELGRALERDAIVFEFDTAEIPDAELRRLIEGKLVTYCTEGFSRNGREIIPRNVPLKAFLGEGGSAFSTIGLEADFRVYSEAERELGLAQHKYKPQISA